MAMGTKMGPSYANLFVGYIEHLFFNQYNGPKPDLYRRYIDDCVGTTSSTREELNQFITAAGKFPILLWHFWILKFLSKATVYAPVCTTNPQIPTVICCIHLHIHHMSRILFLILSFLDFVAFVVKTDFSLKSEEMCELFDKRGYPASVVEAGHHRPQQIDRQSALQTSQKENSNRIPLTLTFHLHNHAVKSIILKSFKLLQNDPDTGRIFSQPPLISFKRD